jgi:hypothetical protein
MKPCKFGTNLASLSELRTDRFVEVDPAKATAAFKDGVLDIRKNGIDGKDQEKLFHEYLSPLSLVRG